LNVFNTLFHTPNQNDKPEEIAWQDFLHVMASTGFAIAKALWFHLAVHTNEVGCRTQHPVS
jgi:hypothetical protein